MRDIRSEQNIEQGKKEKNMHLFELIQKTQPAYCVACVLPLVYLLCLHLELLFISFQK
jgi:hypothetical protein